MTDRMRHLTQGADELLIELHKAEAELLAWCKGERSFTNEMQSIEVCYSYQHSDGLYTFDSDRQLTLVRIAQRDAAEIEFARQRVLALRTLLETPALGEGRA